MTDLLPTDLQEFVREELAAGKYESEAHLFTDALRMLRDHAQRTAALRAKLQPAIDRMDRGESKPLDMDAIRADVERRLASLPDAD